MKQLFNKIKGNLSSFLIRFVGLALQFGLGILIARLLGTTGSGIYSIYTSWFNLLSNVAAFGIPQLSTRKVSVLFSEKKFQEITDFMVISFKIFAATGTVIIFIFILGGDLIAEFFAGGEEQGYILKLAAVAALAFVSLKFLSEILKSINQLNTAIFIESFVLPLFSVGAVLGVFFIPITDKPSYFLVTHIVLLVFLSCLSWIVCKKNLANDKLPHPENPETTRFVDTKTLFTFWISTTLGMWFLNMPLLIAPIFSNLHDTGIFSAAYRLITVIVNVMMVLSGIYGPKFARHFNEKKYADLRKDLATTGYISLAFFSPLCAIFLFFPENILGIFGAEFVAGADWLKIMALGQLIYSATGLVGLMMNMIHQEKTELGLMAVSAFLMLVLMLFLGNLYAITGIAVAFSFGLAFKNLASLFFARKLLKKLANESL